MRWRIAVFTLVCLALIALACVQVARGLWPKWSGPPVPMSR